MPAETLVNICLVGKMVEEKLVEKDPLFNKMEADMHNLKFLLLVKQMLIEVTLDMGADKPKTKMYGECKFEVDFDANRAM